MTTLIGNRLGSGSFGNVHLGNWKSGPCAIKINNDTESSSEYILSADFYLRFVHKDVRASSFIVERYSIVKIDNLKIGLITELFDMNLKDYLKIQFRENPEGLSFGLTKQLTKQLTGAFHFLHQKGLMYPNPKPKHILVSANGSIVKLGNLERVYFDNAVYGDLPLSRDFSVSPFSSPELLLNTKPSVASPLWALAVIVARIFTGKVLFQSKSTFEMLASQRFMLQKDHALDVQPRASLLCRLIYQESFRFPCTQTETLNEIIRCASVIKQENSEQVELILDLLYKMFDGSSYTEILNHPFLEPMSGAAVEDVISPIKNPLGDLSIEAEDLGQGAFGCVKKATLRINGIVQGCFALKQGHEDCDNKELLNEYKMLSLLSGDPQASSVIVNKLGIYIVNQKIGLLFEKMETDLSKYLHKKSSL